MKKLTMPSKLNFLSIFNVNFENFPKGKKSAFSKTATLRDAGEDQLVNKQIQHPDFITRSRELMEALPSPLMLDK